MYFISSVVILLTTWFIYELYTTNQKENFSGYQNKEFNLPYNVSTPDSVYVMPKELTEISALSFQNPDQVFTVNDEKALLYSYDLASEKITSKIDFGKRGDYESVACIGNIVYVSESNGNLKVVDVQLGEKIDELDTPLSSKNNVEGLCFDESKNQLLIACKGDLLKKEKGSNARGIYSYDLANNKFNKDPFRLINLNKESKNLAAFNLGTDHLSKFSSTARLESFAPSAVEINPISKNIFMLSSRGRTMIVMNANKELLGIYFLSSSVFRQPEGIAFNDVGDMFISNEGRSKKGNILKFARTNN